MILCGAQVEVQLLKAENVHEEFRLWITAEPHPSFPIGLLHMGLKLTNEAPVGIRAGLQASYSWLSQVELASKLEYLSLFFSMNLCSMAVMSGCFFGLHNFQEMKEQKTGLRTWGICEPLSVYIKVLSAARLCF